MFVMTLKVEPPTLVDEGEAAVEEPVVIEDPEAELEMTLPVVDGDEETPLEVVEPEPVP